MKTLTAAVAGGITGVVVSAVCAALVVVLPVGFAKSYSGAVFHGIDVSSLIVAPQFTLIGLLLGLVYSLATGFVIGGVFAAAYNWADKKFK